MNIETHFIRVIILKNSTIYENEPKQICKEYIDRYGNKFVKM